MRTNVISSRWFIRQAMLDLEKEWAVRVGGREGGERRLPEEAVKMLIYRFSRA